MKITIEIPEEEVKEAVKKVIAEQYYQDYSSDRRFVRKIVSECVREIIYKDKEDIVDRIVAQASRECRSKAVKKILDNLGEGA